MRCDGTNTMGPNEFCAPRSGRSFSRRPRRPWMMDLPPFEFLRQQRDPYELLRRRRRRGIFHTQPKNQKKTSQGRGPPLPTSILIEYLDDRSRSFEERVAPKNKGGSVGRHTPPDMIQNTHTNLFGWIETTGQDSLGSKEGGAGEEDGRFVPHPPPPYYSFLGGEKVVRIVRQSDPPLL
jgi:hypothetical protein